ncbi:hypothetical protein NUH86_15965 [Sphingobium sp. JS3065]|uniref:hypothetical protein n=1 Tax=Sphingobium sp. JS3065 TaxID=2970925 RepID=UPI002264C3B3|nr:hypothetical protein [Sphingobium sp. JS3065]UZW54950.1 hypothetical protein NUH86_15965 [Sphingobium sp. JS3065]
MKNRNRRRAAAAGKAEQKKKAAAPGIEAPTEELQHRVNFSVRQVTTEAGQVLGLAYRRTPLIETMAARNMISAEELAVLRFYRTAFDRCERSPVKCALNISGVSSSSPAHALFHATPSMLDAKKRLRICENSFGKELETMRGVVLADKSFSDLAIERFGSRIVKPARHMDRAARQRGEHQERILPKSGRHREIVRQEFLSGLRSLAETVRGMVARSAIEEIWVQPLQDGKARIRRGSIAPQGTYWCWGDPELVDMIMGELHRLHGDDLMFSSAAGAIDALKSAEKDRLKSLEAEELAA